MPEIATAIMGGASILGGMMQADASESAADAQTQAAGQSDATQRYMFDRSAELQQPWRNAGTDAVQMMQDRLSPGSLFHRFFTMDDFNADPGYNFRLSEGRRALEGSAAARGRLLSGGTGKALLRYGQEMGANEYANSYNRWNSDRDRVFNRMASVAGLGQTASRDVSANAMSLGARLGENALQAGNARASGYVGGANAISGGIGGAINSYQSQQLLSSLTRRPYTMSDYGSGGTPWADYTPFGP